jgi:hypothetical protein
MVTHPNSIARYAYLVQVVVVGLIPLESLVNPFLFFLKKKI